MSSLDAAVKELVAQRLRDLAAFKRDLGEDTFDADFLLFALAPEDAMQTKFAQFFREKVGSLQTGGQTTEKAMQTVPVREPSPQQTRISLPPAQKPRLPESPPDKDPAPPAPKMPRAQRMDSKPMQFGTANTIDSDNAKPAREALQEITKAFEASNAAKQQQIEQQKQQELAQQPPEENEKQSKYINALIADGVVTKPTLTLASIHGMRQTKQLLEDTVLLPLNFPNLFQNRESVNRVLLHSLPGCGKSFIAKCIAGEVGRPLITATPGQLYSKWQGTSEKLVRALFQLAGQTGPCVLFLDELDALCSKRDSSDSESTRRVKNQILVELDNMPQDVLLLGATNLPFEIDAAVRRRFEKRVFVTLPDLEAKESMIQSWVKAKLANKDEICQRIAQKTEGFSGADIRNLCKSVDFIPLQKLQMAQWFCQKGTKWAVCAQGAPDAQQKRLKDLVGQDIEEPELTWEDIEPAVGRIKSSVKQEDIEAHLSFQNEFGSE